MSLRTVPLAIPRFGQIATQLLSNGYRPLPINFGEKAPAVSEDWPSYVFTDGDAERYVRCGTGILCGPVVGVDMDVADRALAEQIDALAVEYLGRAPCRIGKAPKRLRVYAVDGDEFAKIQTRGYRLPDDKPDAKLHRVEVLARGNQFVGFNRHEDTRRPYEWNGAGSLLEVPASMLPRVTRERLEQFISAVEALLQQHGLPAGELREADDQRKRDTGRQSSAELRAADPGVLRDALRAIPNPDVEFDDWLHLLYAVKGALGADGRGAFMEWSALSFKHDPEFTAKQYGAAKPKRKGAGSVYFHAQRNGWTRPAASDPDKSAPLPDEWRGLLRREGKQLIRDEENLRIILANDPQLIGIARYNEFSGELQLTRPIPDTGSVRDHGTPRRWRDADTVALTTYIQRTTMAKVSSARVEAAIGYYARYHGSFHPLRDYLQGLCWDGKPRVSTWLTDYLGAGDPGLVLYLTAVGAAFLVSAVARVFEPGCQADCALVLEGEQGIFKSTCLRILAGDEWFSDSLPSDLKHKDAKDHLRGKWIIELPELAQFKRNEIETVKAFLSRRHEQFRPSYGRHEISYPRQCVFAGSTNDDHYLVDGTGNRRFWCVKCGDIDVTGLAADRDQLWAEAVALYRKGAPWHLTGDALDAAAGEASERVAEDPWTAMVSEALRRLPQNVVDVSPSEILRSLDLATEQMHPRNAVRVAGILRGLGWRKVGGHHRTRGTLYVLTDAGA